MIIHIMILPAKKNILKIPATISTTKHIICFASLMSGKY